MTAGTDGYARQSMELSTTDTQSRVKPSSRNHTGEQHHV